MPRILVVEDNKTLAKLIAKKIATELKIEVDVAFSFAEAKLFLQRYEYFVTLLDLNLPDAPDGEVVDYALKRENHVIVLSGNIDKAFRQEILKKNIIDYVSKSGVNDIHYIIQTIKRLQKNKEHTILVVDDSIVFRKQMQAMLENMFYKVVTVAHGEEALAIIEGNPKFSLVLTDYHMPVMNGLDLTIELRKEYTKNDFPIIAISNNNDEQLTALFLKNGANDYIKKPFSKEEFACRINNSIEALENIQLIINSAHRDYLTGLYNRRYFYKDMNEYFSSALVNDESFTIAMIDIDNFKSVNDTYGHDEGDKAIIALGDILRSNTRSTDLVARFGGEEFCVVLKNQSSLEAEERLEQIRKEVQSNTLTTAQGENYSFTISVGVCNQPEQTLDDMLNEADMRLYNAKQNGKNQLSYS